MHAGAAPWGSFGLTQDEWRDCERSAREMTLASGARIRPRDVAREFARARESDLVRLALLSYSA